MAQVTTLLTRAGLGYLHRNSLKLEMCKNRVVVAGCADLPKPGITGNG